MVTGGGAGDFSYVIPEEIGRKRINGWLAVVMVQGEEDLFLWVLLQFTIWGS